MVTKKYAHLFCLLLFVTQKINATNIAGTSGTTPTDQAIFISGSYNSFVDGDTAEGFVRFNNGFQLPALGTVTFNVWTPVAGPIDLNTGVLKLSGDMFLASTATIISTGFINGTTGGQTNSIFLNGDITIPANVVIQFSGDTIIDGQGHNLIFDTSAPGGRFSIGAGTTLTLRNVNVIGLQNYNTPYSGIFLQSAGSTLILQDAAIHLSDNYTFDVGALMVKGFVSVDGPKKFIYRAPIDCTIDIFSTLFVDMHTTFCYKPSDKVVSHIVMTDQTSRLFLNGSTLSIARNTGLTLTTGNFIIDHNATIAGNNATSQKPLILGDPVNTLAIDIMPAAGLNFETAYVVYNNNN